MSGWPIAESSLATTTSKALAEITLKRCTVSCLVVIGISYIVVTSVLGGARESGRGRELRC